MKLADKEAKKEKEGKERSRRGEKEPNTEDTAEAARKAMGEEPRCSILKWRRQRENAPSF